MPSSAPPLSSEHAEAPLASGNVAPEPNVIWIRLTAERNVDAPSGAPFSIVLDAPMIQLHRVVAHIASPYACRSRFFDASGRGLSVTCTPSFKKPLATVVFRERRIEVHLFDAKSGEETLGFDLPPGALGRGEERELIATELEGRTCAGTKPTRDVDLRASARPEPEGAIGIYLEGSALHERVKMWNIQHEYGCSLHLDEHLANWSLLECRREGQTDDLWLHIESESLLLIWRVDLWGSPRRPIPNDLADLVADRAADVGRISLPCGARVRVREAEFPASESAPPGKVR